LTPIPTPIEKKKGLRRAPQLPPTSNRGRGSG
jgi:hypothetical protein